MRTVFPILALTLVVVLFSSSLPEAAEPAMEFVNIPAGAVLTKELIAVKRPGTGLPPSMTPYLTGRTARVLIPEGTVLQWDMLA